MNSTIINISASFLKENAISINWQELLWGLSQKYISTKEIVEYALNLLQLSNSDNKVLIELCGLTKDEYYKVRDIMETLTIDEKLKSEQEISSKWLFISLLWLYKHKDQIHDPLAIVETVYADFNYPESMNSFVRYMPSEEANGTYEENINQLLKNWEAFLNSSSW